MVKFPHTPLEEASFTLKTVNGQSTGRWQDFSTARVPVSVGKEYHEGGMFKETMLWCAARFQHVEICVSDASQRYNMMFENGLDEKTAFDLALKAGDEWIARNIGFINILPSHHIKRWEEWHTRSDFKDRMLKILSAYDKNSAFRSMVDDTVTDAWTRKSKNHGPMINHRRDEFINLSYRYIFEELVVYSMRFEDLRAIDIYPGTDLIVTTKLQGNCPADLPAGLGLRYLCRIKFSSAKNTAAQSGMASESPRQTTLV